LYMVDTVRLFIDDIEYRVPKGMNLVDAAKLHGNDIPVFCYHPKLAPVGMCRMCLVELGQAEIDRATGALLTDENGKLKVRWQPKLATACTQTVTDGMAIRTTSEAVKVARDDIIEFILTSHPLDCPICDKGGECPLQNLTMRHGAGESRFVFDEKMHLDKHYPLGDLIFLDRERCIQCARCTRFQEEYVGDAVLAFHERGRRLQIVTTSNPPFDTYFSGNTTDICPVGALTTADFRFGARPWELTEVPSICPHCPVGCNISASTRLDREAGGKIVIKRIMPRQHESVNEIWICDKGRFGHHHARHAERISRPLVRHNGKLVPATWEKALSVIAEHVQAANGSVGAIAGGMLSNEDLWELRQLVERAGGTRLGVYPYRLTGAAQVAAVGVGVGTNFKELGKGDAIVVIGTDLEEEAPIWYLRTKVAADRGVRLITINARYTELDRFVKHNGDIIRPRYGGEIAALNALNLEGLNNVIMLVGAEGMNRAAHAALMQAAANKLIETGHYGKPNNGLIGVWAGANTQGAFDLGYSAEATELLLAEPPKVLFLADADLLGGDALSAATLSQAKETFLVVSELFMTATAAQADVVLPRQSFAERDGTFTSGERRVQRFYTAQTPLDHTRPDWKVFAEINRLLGGPKPKLSAAAVMQSITQHVPLYAQMSYPNLAKVEKQFPDVGGADLYYGGTAYDNKGGLGVQWATAAERGEPVQAAPVPEVTLPALGEGELLLVPITELYDRKPTFAASAALMHSHIPAPYAMLNWEDAKALEIAEGDQVQVRFAERVVMLKARVAVSVPKGAVLVARHLGVIVPDVPVSAVVEKVQVAEHV